MPPAAIPPGVRPAKADAARIEHLRLALGAGPRASIGLLRMAGAWAILAGRDDVTADDVKVVAHAVLAHRLVEAQGEVSPARSATITSIVESVPSPI